MSETLHKDISKISLNLKEIEIIKHSLGYDYKDYSFRNSFATPPTSCDGVICEGLVEKGLMVRHNYNNLVGESVLYTCTDDCKKLIMRIGGYKA